MTPDSLPDPLCPLCSKPIPSDATAHGKLLHIHCRAQRPTVKSMGERARASQLASAARDRDVATARGLGSRHTCPLCREPAALVDWRPGVDWVVIEQCPCDGFFIAGTVLDGRMAYLSDEERHELARRVRMCRSAGREAWCTTADGTADGRLVIRTERPD